MYARHFGLNHAPFSIAPDPRFLFMSERHREALAHLLYGVGAGGGFVVLTGEIGAGKTTVCRAFLEQIPARCEVAYIFNPKLTVEELLATICGEFRVPWRHDGPGAATVKDYFDALNLYLLRTHAIGRSNVLIIDEAQSLSADALEHLRLLTNLETNEHKLLHIVLIGQPELRAMLARPELQQLAQRVIARYHLGALDEAETERYVRHRLAVAGLGGPLPFDARALRRVYRHSRGVPRRINLLCDRALLGAYSRDQAIVDSRIVDEAAREILPRPERAADGRPGPGRAMLLGLGIAAGAAFAGGLALSLDLASDRGQQARIAPAPSAAPAPAPAEQPGVQPAAQSDVQPAAQPAHVAAAAARETGGEPDRTLGAVASPSAQLAEAEFDLPRGFASLMRAEAPSWRELARAWHVESIDGDPCAAAQKHQVHCFRTNRATLSTIRQMDRPGILTLRDAGNRAAYAVLRGLSEKTATLSIEGEPRTVSLISLADFWRGEFATFWRVPQGYSGKDWATWPGPGAQWLARQLSAVRGDARPVGQPVDEATLRGLVHAFQLTQGLPSDGIAGPVTLMQLNRALGVDEPRLASWR